MRLANLLALFALPAIVGCSSVPDDFCEKLDECNLLANQSVDGCIETTEKSLDNMTDSKRADCEEKIEECLDKESCANFAQCVNTATECQ